MAAAAALVTHGAARRLCRAKPLLKVNKRKFQLSVMKHQNLNVAKNFQKAHGGKY